jgi:hypothetical protein
MLDTNIKLQKNALSEKIWRSKNVDRYDVQIHYVNVPHFLQMYLYIRFYNSCRRLSGIKRHFSLLGF